MALPLIPILLVLQANPGGSGASDSEAAYWQQEVSYTIEGYLDEAAGEFRGAGEMRYSNRSGQALGEVFFHLYLNAFRPNSLWAQAEERPQYDFQALEEPDYAYERLGSMRMNGQLLDPEFPFAPDSTVVRFDLPQAIPIDGSASFRFEWAARPSTLCRRQCRRGRSFDFAQWYPRVAVYDRDGWQAHPLYPQGEFYGEYGVFDVTLDLAEDQVVGATGVVAEGDPGWGAGPGGAGGDNRDLPDPYPTLPADRALEFLSPNSEAGRRRVRFVGEDVHHFAWSTSPDYRYEGGSHGDVAVHVLFRPGDLDWDLGAVVGRSIRALEWLETVFGPYPYPQLTNVHRLEGGGTEFPMLVMNGSPGQGLIIHELAHQYAMGILGSNEWKDAYLDEGMASFLSSWFMEEVGGVNPWPNTVTRLGEAEARGALSVPVATVSDEMPGFGVYNMLAYTKPSIVYRMLRELVGWETMREGLSTYFRRKSFQHVVEDDLRRAMEDAFGQPLDWFFQQWFHTTATLDYAVSEVSVTRTGSGWTTEATITRRGEAWMPVVVEVGPERQTLEGRAASQRIEVVTTERPDAVVVDPDLVLLDIDRSNNRAETVGL